MCIVFLSSGTQSCWEQLYTIVQAVDMLPVGAVVPVNLPGFKFPPEAFYLDTLHTMITGDIVIRDKFRKFFRIIAVSLSTNAAHQILSVQADEVCSRLTSVMKATIFYVLAPRMYVSPQHDEGRGYGPSFRA